MEERRFVHDDGFSMLASRRRTKEMRRARMLREDTGTSGLHMMR